MPHNNADTRSPFKSQLWCSKNTLAISSLISSVFSFIISLSPVGGAGTGNPLACLLPNPEFLTGRTMLVLIRRNFPSSYLITLDHFISFVHPPMKFSLSEKPPKRRRKFITQLK
ncbi:hypothetical protein CEXT_661561 [Caerostris extrusa]|uniref:Uncharacterized protein n=1 Tax=Caerostris extrusa TaxID=172846 RepID=A0AAV4PR69_CAEEX|nr:hypothetical protein CEXT_661561 [Caerostris extrusa]